MKRRALSLIMAIALAASLLAGCGGNSGNNTSGNTNTGSNTDTGDTTQTGEKVLRCGWSIGEEPHTYDPAVQWSANAVSSTYLMLEPLMAFQEDGSVVGGAAESYDVSEDGLTYTFHLRDGLMWSDGEPLTAEDFAYTLIRALDPATGSDSISSFMVYIKNGEAYYKGEVGLEEVGIKAVDDKTLVYELETPFAPFPELLTAPIAAPSRKDIVEANPDTWGMSENGFPANGPFVPVSIKMGTSIEYVKNDKYWNADNVKLDRIVINYFADANTAWSAYQAGELDMLTSAPSGTVKDLYTKNSEELIVYPTLYTNYVLLNTREENLGDITLRKAIFSAIDREGIINSSTTSFLSSFLDGIVPPNVYMNGKEFRAEAGSYYLKPNADLDAAAKYLEEAGYPGGEGLRTLQILTDNSEGPMQTAQIIQEQLKAANIPTEIVPVESKAFWPMELEGKYDICVTAGIGSVKDPSDFLPPASPSVEWCPEVFYDPAYDEVITKARPETDPEKRLEYYMEAERIMMEYYGRLPISTRVSTLVAKPYVDGLWATVTGFRSMATVDIVNP